MKTKKRRRLRVDRLLIVVLVFLSFFSALVFVAFKGIKTFAERTYAQEQIKEIAPEGKIEVPEFMVTVDLLDKASMEEEKDEFKKVYLGKFLITAYCGCYQCSEEYGTMTSTGGECKPNHTVAVDPTRIEYFSNLMIEGLEDCVFVAEDCGGAIVGNHIDIYVENHEDCFSDLYNGYRDVWLLIKEWLIYQSLFLFFMSYIRLVIVLINKHNAMATKVSVINLSVLVSMIKYPNITSVHRPKLIQNLSFFVNPLFSIKKILQFFTKNLTTFLQYAIITLLIVN